MSGKAYFHRIPTTDVTMHTHVAAYLRPDGGIGTTSLALPVCLDFDDAFCGLGRGAVLHRRDGPVAVEDVVPGDHLRCRNGHFAQVIWHGLTTLSPHGPACGSAPTLTRIRADALGPGLPMQDMILGPAGYLQHGASGRGGQPADRTAASDFIDGDQFIALRPTQPVTLYQIGFADPQTMLANGIGVASLQPHQTFGTGLNDALRQQYQSLFPHLHRQSDSGPIRHRRRVDLPA